MLHVPLWLGVRGVVVVGVVIYSVILTQLLTTVESVSTQSCVCVKESLSSLSRWFLRHCQHNQCFNHHTSNTT